MRHDGVSQQSMLLTFDNPATVRLVVRLDAIVQMSRVVRIVRNV